MQKIRRMSIMLAVAIFTLAVSVCSASPSWDGPETSPEETVINALQQMAALKSCHFNMDVTAALSFQGKSLDASIKGGTDCVQKPLLCNSTYNLTVDLDSEKFQRNFAQYIEESGDKTIIYTNIDNHWTQMAQPTFSPNINFNDYAKSITKVRMLRNDGDLAVFEVKVASGSLLKDTMDQYMTATGAPVPPAAADVLKDLGDFKYTVTINRKTSLVTRFDMDLSEFVAKLGNSILQTLNMPEDKTKPFQEALRTVKIRLSMSFSQYDAVGPITIPPEVKANDSVKTL